jgi:hypothetical protein
MSHIVDLEHSECIAEYHRTVDFTPLPPVVGDSNADRREA